MRTAFVAAGLLLSGLLLSSATAHAQSPGARAFDAAFGPCRGSTCVVRSNPGGDVRRFVAAARAVRAGAKRLVVIDGPCASACVIFADIARDRVCITDRATFGFHKATLFRAERRTGGERRWRQIARHDPVHSADIDRWVRRNGGFPSRGLRMMDNRDAGQFWRRCQMRR